MLFINRSPEDDSISKINIDQVIRYYRYYDEETKWLTITIVLSDGSEWKFYNNEAHIIKTYLDKKLLTFDQLDKLTQEE